jgi:hypothetical protein
MLNNKCECRQVPTGVKCPSTFRREMETIECGDCAGDRFSDQLQTELAEACDGGSSYNQKAGA